MSNHADLPQNGEAAKRLDVSAAALWASAFVILALVIMQAGRLHSGGGSPAYAGDVSVVGDLAILTAEAGDQEDILAILDRRSERMFIYGVNSRREVELLQNYDIGRVFVEAREASGQARRP